MSIAWICCQCKNTNSDLSDTCPMTECDRHTRCENCETKTVQGDTVPLGDSYTNGGIISQPFSWTCCNCGGGNADWSEECPLCGHCMDSTCVTTELQSSLTTSNVHFHHSTSSVPRDDDGWICCQCGSSNSWGGFCSLCSHEPCGNCGS
jgi:hypothetical protein